MAATVSTLLNISVQLKAWYVLTGELLSGCPLLLFGFLRVETVVSKRRVKTLVFWGLAVSLDE